MQTLPNLMDNPQFKALIDGFAEIIQTCSTDSLEAGRKRCTEFFLSNAASRKSIEKVEDMEIPGRNAHQIPLRIYDPAPSQNLPIVVYLHRGGWVFGNIEESDPVCRLLASCLQCVIVSVDYRLAPENPFPRPLHDAYDATLWAHRHLTSSKQGPRPLIICGESAGGNLAGAVALMARDCKEFSLAAQWLIYPMINPTLCEDYYNQCPDRHFMTKESISFMWGAYLQSPEFNEHPYAALDLTKDLSKLPPTLIITGEYDPLRYEAEHYGHLLRRAGVAVHTKQFPKVIHGFLDLPLYTEEQKIGWIQEIKKHLKLLSN